MGDQPRRKKGRKIGDYVVLKKIGQGQFGKVFLAENENTGAKMALKQLKIEQIARNEDLRRNFKSELSIMHKLHHPNVIRCEEFYESEHHYYVLMEFCNEGTLEFLNSPRRPDVKVEKCLEYWLQIKEGFRALRKAKVIHRDVKLENLLLKDGVLKISDFGVARFGKEACNTTMVGTLLTMAPEVMNPRAALAEAEANMLDSSVQLEYTSKVDLWSIGVVYYEILFGDFPFFGFNPGELIHNMKTKSGEKLEMKAEVPTEMANLLRRLLVFDPNERISWDEFFDHPAFDIFQIPIHLRKLYPHLKKKWRKNISKTSLDEMVSNKLHSRKSLEQMARENKDLFMRKNTLTYTIENGKFEDSTYFLYSNTPVKSDESKNFLFPNKAEGRSNWRSERRSGRQSEMERIEESELEHVGSKKRKDKTAKKRDKNLRGSSVRSTLKALQRREKKRNNSRKKTALHNKIRERAIEISRNINESMQNMIASKNPIEANYSITNYAVVPDNVSTNDTDTAHNTLEKENSNKINNRFLKRHKQTEIDEKREKYKKRHAPSPVEENSRSRSRLRGNRRHGLASKERERKKRESGIQRLIDARKKMRTNDLSSTGSNLGKHGILRGEAIKNRVLGNSTHLVEASSSKRAGIRRDSDREQMQFTPRNLADSQIEIMGRLVAHRYSHEKNKVMFIHLSIKKTRELIKMKVNKSIEENLYMSIILMMRKAALLTENTLQSLTEKVNIFEEKEFDKFLESTSYSEIVNEYSNDLPNFRAYSSRLMAWALASAPQLKSELRRIEILERSSEKIKSGVASTLNLVEIDAQLKVQYSLLRRFPIEKIGKGSYKRVPMKTKRLFYMTLVKLKYSIFCDKYFPYKSGDSVFDWKLFFSTFQSVSLDMLRKLAGVAKLDY